MKHIPNILSFIRLLCVPVFILLFFNGYTWAAAGVFVFASATDVLDGWLARRFNWITSLGKVLDPIADKLNQITVLLCITIRAYMTEAPTFPIVLTVFIILLVKEFLMIAGGLLIIRKKKFVVYALWYGKLATVLFFAVTLTLMLAPESFVLSLILCILLVAAILFALVMYYIKVFRKQFTHSTPEKESDSCK